jgi:hypothetical protein
MASTPEQNIQPLHSPPPVRRRGTMERRGGLPPRNLASAFAAFAAFATVANANTRGIYNSDAVVPTGNTSDEENSYCYEEFNNL